MFPLLSETIKKKTFKINVILPFLHDQGQSHTYGDKESLPDMYETSVTSHHMETGSKNWS